MTDHPAKRPTKRCLTHPGAVLREDVLPAMKISVSEAARDLGVSRQTLHKILAENAPITPETALRLGKFCGNGPELWINMQVNHDLWKAEHEMAATLKRIPTKAAA